MATYVILSKISHEAFAEPKGFKEVANRVAEKIKRECPGVTWKDSYATLGRFDVVDVIESDDPRQVEKAALWVLTILGRLCSLFIPAPAGWGIRQRMTTSRLWYQPCINTA